MGCIIVLAGAATALSQAPRVATDDKVLADADRAAERMVTRWYIVGVPAWKRPSEIVAKLRELGYRNFHDFDIGFRRYEVEATAPNGEEVEIELDPITGAILEVDEDFF